MRDDSVQCHLAVLSEPYLSGNLKGLHFEGRQRSGICLRPNPALFYSEPIVKLCTVLGSSHWKVVVVSSPSN